VSPLSYRHPFRDNGSRVTSVLPVEHRTWLG
jgi:hypothetical protein